MAGGVISLCARALASALHRTAGALDGLSARLSGESAAADDPALAALAERYPGAPRHWLAHIAARAPHLADGKAADGAAAAAPGPDVLPPSPSAPALKPLWEAKPPPRRRAWLTFLPQHRERHAPPAPRRLARRLLSERGFATPFADAERRAPPPGPDRPSTRPQPRPRLTFQSPDSTPKPAGAPRPPPQARRRPGDLALAAPSQRAAATAPAPMALAGEARGAPPPVQADPATPRSFAARLTLSPVAGRGGSPGPLARWWQPNRRRGIASGFASDPPSQPARPPLEGWPATAPFRTVPAAPFGHADADPAQRQGFEADPWPTPPPWDADIQDASVGPADLGRLRAEQDDGAWNG